MTLDLRFCGGMPPYVAWKKMREGLIQLSLTTAPRHSKCPGASSKGLACYFHLIIDVKGLGSFYTGPPQGVSLTPGGTSTIFFSAGNWNCPEISFLWRLLGPSFWNSPTACSTKPPLQYPQGCLLDIQHHVGQSASPNDVDDQYFRINNHIQYISIT